MKNNNMRKWWWGMTAGLAASSHDSTLQSAKEKEASWLVAVRPSNSSVGLYGNSSEGKSERILVIMISRYSGEICRKRTSRCCDWFPFTLLWSSSTTTNANAKQKKSTKINWSIVDCRCVVCLVPTQSCRSEWHKNECSTTIHVLRS